MEKKVIWMLLAMVAGLIAWSLFAPIAAKPQQRPPFYYEFCEMRELSLKLSEFAFEHPDSMTATNIEGFVSAGALSTADATYIRSHQIQFHSFEASQTNTTPILEGTFTNGLLRCSIIGYSDGSVKRFD